MSLEKDGNCSNDVEDKFKDDKFKDDPDVRGILSDIKGHFDQNDKGIHLPPDPNEESVANKVSIPKKNTGLFGNFSQHGGGGLPNSQNPKPKKSAFKSP